MNPIRSARVLGALAALCAATLNGAHAQVDGAPPVTAGPGVAAPDATASVPEATDAAEVEAEAAAPAVAPAVAPFGGSLGHGLAEVRRLAEAGDTDAALDVSERLLAPDLAGRARAWLERRSDGLSERALSVFDGALSTPLRALGLDPGTAEERAEVHFARGVVLRRALRAADAQEAYDLVRGLGGDARVDAVYELGHLALSAGEVWRAQIPELAQQPGAAPGNAAGAAPNALPGAAPGGAPDAPDPLAEARKAYTSALASFVERLRLDWQDGDTRANVELVRRRLRELDEIERKREEQQQDQQEQDPNSEEKSDEQKPDSKPEQDPQKQDEQQDPEQKDPQQQDPEEGEQQEPEEPKPDEASESEPEEEAAEEPPKETPEPTEVNLTKEELQRLMQRLKEHRELGEEVEKALRQRNRGRAARDW